MVGTLLIYNGFDFISQKSKNFEEKKVLLSCLVAPRAYRTALKQLDKPLVALYTCIIITDEGVKVLNALFWQAAAVEGNYKRPSGQ